MVSTWVRLAGSPFHIDASVSDPLWVKSGSNIEVTSQTHASGRRIREQPSHHRLRGVPEQCVQERLRSEGERNGDTIQRFYCKQFDGGRNQGYCSRQHRSRSDAPTLHQRKASSGRCLGYKVGRRLHLRLHNLAYRGVVSRGGFVRSGHHDHHLWESLPDAKVLQKVFKVISSPERMTNK
ncbi:FXYD domain containing ion transport regulator 5 isoform X4 [Synchiropus splendidus]|uniref:FXYD domain containing ion transport regulator 5 isoform X4 n=1 Tax=Synchiropus splendidus TaxID=270530 RepID=UPI00237DEE48|nr:FXYD domain containing ion transport regulator 5 isoform X4 [Synchiropus splendidus]